MDITEYIESKLSEPSDYSKGYVAFLDLLGFIEMCRNEPCEYIKAIIDDIDFQKMEFPKFGSLIISNEILAKIDTKLVSDSIIVTTPDDIQGLLYILYYCSVLHTMLLSANILVRGGIAYGEYFSSNNTVFGPALAEAHDIESQISIYPRVVLSNKIVAQLNEMKTFEKLSAEKSVEKYTKNDVQTDDRTTEIRLLTKFSEDGFLFVNYFNVLENMKLKKLPHRIKQIDSFIKQNLKDNKDKPKLLPKYEWLERYFRENILEKDILAPLKKYTDVE